MRSKNRDHLRHFDLLMLSLAVASLYQGYAMRKNAEEAVNNVRKRAAKAAKGAIAEVFGTVVDKTKEVMIEAALARLLPGAKGAKLLKGGTP